MSWDLCWDGGVVAAHLCCCDVGMCVENPHSLFLLLAAARGLRVRCLWVAGQKVSTF